jgi:hypothetical protein
LWLGEGAHPIVYVASALFSSSQWVLTRALQNDIEVDDLHLVWTRWHRYPAVGECFNI